jgi:hypothetical protein
MNKDPWAVIHRARIIGGWKDQETYNNIEEWVAKTPGAFFDKARGISYINGQIFFSDVQFETEEDVLVFKLTFPEMVV